MSKQTIRGYCLVAAFAIAFYLGLSNLSQVFSALGVLGHLMSPFFIGVIIAFLVNFPLRWFEKEVFSELAKHKSPRIRKLVRPLSLLCAYLLLFLLLTLLLNVVLPQLADSLTNLSSNIPSNIKTLQSYAERLITDWKLDPALLEEINNWFWLKMKSLPDLLLNLLKSMPQFAAMIFSVGGGVLNAVIGLIVSVYLLLGKELLFSQMDRTIRAFLPEDTALRVRGIAAVSVGTFSNYVSGRLLDALFVGIVSVVGLWLFRFPYWLLIGVIMGITNIIPFFGPIIGAVPGFIILLIVSPPKALFYLLFVLVVQQVDGNLVGPKIIGDSIGLPALWVLFSVTLGGGLFGIPGMVLSTPIFAIIYTLFGRLVRGRLRASEADGETKSDPNTV